MYNNYTNESGNIYRRHINTESFGEVYVVFSYVPEEKGNNYEPYVPVELEVLSVQINDCEAIADLDEDEFFQVREAIFDLLDEEEDV